MEKKKLPNLIVIGILTVLTIFFWIGFGIYSLLSKPAEVNVPANISRPLSPNLDVEALSQIETKTFFTNEQINTVLIVPPPEPTVSPTSQPETESETP